MGGWPDHHNRGRPFDRGLIAMSGGTSAPYAATPRHSSLSIHFEYPALSHNAFRHILRVIHAEGGGAMEEFDRITHNPAVMGGKACIRGMRVTAGMIVRQIGAGRTIDELLADYPYLEREDIHQALSYAA